LSCEQEVPGIFQRKFCLGCFSSDFLVRFVHINVVTFKIFKTSWPHALRFFLLSSFRFPPYHEIIQMLRSISDSSSSNWLKKVKLTLIFHFLDKGPTGINVGPRLVACHVAGNWLFFRQNLANNRGHLFNIHDNIFGKA